MGENLKRWLEKDGAEFFSKMGLSRGQIVLDFGCGTGNYAIPAAVIVGREGRVYALDKQRQGFWPSEGLGELISRVESKALPNIVVIQTSGELKIKLEDESIDVVLLHDVLHYYYFPRRGDRIELLREIYRVLRPDGFISFYPGDPEASHNYSELETIRREIEEADFHPESEYAGTVIHENVIQEGRVVKFRKVT